MASPTEEAAVDSYCIDFCKGKLTVLGVDVEAAWKPKVRDGENQSFASMATKNVERARTGFSGSFRRARDLFSFFFFLVLWEGGKSSAGCTRRGA